MNFSTITLGGRLGKTPTFGATNKGTDVTRFSLAVNSGFGDRKETTWYSVSIYGRSAKSAADNLRKGGLAVVWGEPSLREYEVNGEKRQSLDVNADGWAFGGPKQDIPSEAAQAPSQTPIDGLNDDIPF
jgi:single-strand DNA-binding protein